MNCPDENWIQVEIELGNRDPSAFEQALLRAGALSVEYRDAADQPILEPAPGAIILWRELKLVALFEDTVETALFPTILSLAAGAADCPKFSTTIVKDRDWAREWQRDARPAQFGERLWIYPTTVRADPSHTALYLDPGLAFGTGTHPTTALCLEWLARLPLDGRHVLDYGCGSGILALGALALGATHALAIDNDPQARIATANNAKLNSLCDRLEIREPGDAHADRGFDVVVANILSNTLIELAPRLTAHARAGAAIAMTGILPAQAAAVRQAYSDDFRFDPDQERDGWILISGKARTTA